MSKVILIRYIFDMRIIDVIYESVDDFGLITSADARDLGVSNVELAQQARRGKLTRVARGVYQMPIWPYQPAAPYAIATKAAGRDSYLYGESVVALLELAPTDPTRIVVASPARVRRNIGNGVVIVGMRPAEETVFYEGIRCQQASNAIRAAMPRLGKDQMLMAAKRGYENGYLTRAEFDELSM